MYLKIGIKSVIIKIVLIQQNQDKVLKLCMKNIKVIKIQIKIKTNKIIIQVHLRGNGNQKKYID